MARYALFATYSRDYGYEVGFEVMRALSDDPSALTGLFDREKAAQGFESGRLVDLSTGRVASLNSSWTSGRWEPRDEPFFQDGKKGEFQVELLA